MAEGSIATAYVTIRPDLGDFKEELRAGLDTETDLTKTVKVDADTGEARLEMDELQARIDELGSKSETIKIGTSGSARAQIRDIQDALIAFRNESLVPSMDPARMEAINSELDGLDSRLRTVGTDLDTTSTKADRTAASLGEGGGSGGAGLLGAAVAAAPALATVGVVGAGALSALAIAAGASVLGLGAFAVAAKNSLAGAKTQADAMVSSWQAAQEKFTDPVIEQAVGLIPEALRLATPSVASTASALQSLEVNAASALGSPYWTQFSTYIAGEGGSAIRSLGGLFGGLGTALAGVAEGFAPELARMDSDMQRWAQDLSRWGQDARNGGLTGLMDYLQQNGPLVAHTFEQLGSDIATLAKDSAPLGPIWLNIANVAARLLGDLESLNPELTAWAVGLGSAAYGVNRLLGPVGGLSGALTGLKGVVSDVGNFGAIATGSAEASGLVGKFAGSLGLAAAGGEEAAAGAGAAAIGIGALSIPLGIATAGLGLLAAGFIYGASQASNLAKASSDSAQSFVNSFLQQAEASGVTGKALQDLITQEEHQAAVQSYMEGGNIKWNDVVKDLQSSYDSLNAQMAGSAAATTAVGGATQNTALATANLTSQLQSANQTLSQTEQLLNTLLGTELSAAQATTGFYNSVATLTGSLHTNGTALNGTTTAALANQQAFEGVGASITSVISSMEKQGATSDQIVGKVSELTGYIEAQAGKYGLTTAQVDSYLQQLGLTPAQVKTDLQLSGYSAASTQVSSIQGQLNSLPRQVNINLNLTGSAVAAGIVGPIGNYAGAVRAHAAGTSSAPGGLSLVGELGAETMITPAGRVSLVGKKGPEVVDVPKGSRILTASQTAALPHYADGIGNRPSLAAINVNDNRTVLVGDIASKADVMQALDADRAELLAEIGQLVPA